ncbi:MAG TPA: hypothetical protein DCY13_24440 [Verrucomicrobiales bacterium]|jgi:hypothetical protein|nr:hypothetical protein [Verrucomicrobiales bacterium]
MSQSPERQKGFSLALFLGALVLLALATAGLEGRLLMLSTPVGRGKVESEVAVNQFESLFQREAIGGLVSDDQRQDVFATTYFNKPKPPEPAPEPPRTRQAALTYLGTISGSRGEPAAFVRVDEAVRRFDAGAVVIDEWRIGQIESSALMLTNGAATNQLGFRQTVQVEVPIR